MESHSIPGVSVIICCHNSAKRITPTLQALALQQSSGLEWEIILVDNYCTDTTISIASLFLETVGKRISYRIIAEPKLGLLHARMRGVSESKYSYLLFCDDDTWLAPDYIQEVYSILNSDSSIAACGGNGEAVFEGAKPEWFNEYGEAFATGSQDITSYEGNVLHLYGAGMGINKSILQLLLQSGFTNIFEGRRGKQLSSSEDTELSYAFILMGYKLFYSEKLKFFHYMPGERLTFNYLNRLFKSFGADGPVRNLYYANISGRVFHKWIRVWEIHLLLSFFRIAKYLIVPPKKNGRRIFFNWNMAYLKNLFLIRKDYEKINDQISRIKNIAIPN